MRRGLWIFRWSAHRAKIPWKISWFRTTNESLNHISRDTKQLFSNWIFWPTTKRISSFQTPKLSQPKEKNLGISATFSCQNIFWIPIFLQFYWTTWSIKSINRSSKATILTFFTPRFRSRSTWTRDATRPTLWKIFSTLWSGVAMSSSPVREIFISSMICISFSNPSSTLNLVISSFLSTKTP